MDINEPSDAATRRVMCSSSYVRCACLRGYVELLFTLFFKASISSLFNLARWSLQHHHFQPIATVVLFTTFRPPMMIPKIPPI